MITPIGKFDPRRLFVRRMVIRIVLIVVVTAAAALILLAVFTEQTDLIVRSAIVVGGALIALTLTNGLASQLEVEGAAAATGRGRDAKPGSNWPADLLEIEGRVSLSKVSLFDHQSRLRPLFRELAAARLAANRNIDLASRPDEARQVLGAELWNEIQPPPAAGDLRELPGPTSAAIRRMVETLESI